MGLYPGELHPKNVDKPVQIVWPGCIYEALNFHGHNLVIEAQKAQVLPDSFFRMA